MNKKNEVVKRNLPDIGKKAMSNMLAQVMEFAAIEGAPLTEKEKSYAAPIVFEVIKQVNERKLEWNEVDVKGVIQQIKDYSRLGLSINENEIYINIRRNGKTGLQEVLIDKQYQGVQKILSRWSTKKIVRFLEGVICKGDEFESGIDFMTGLEKVISHKKNQDIDRHKLENIIGAYAIAYVEEDDELVQYAVIIDKNRIMRSYNASPTREKPIWNADTTRMVTKTAIWALYRHKLKPFVQVPTELKREWERTDNADNYINAEIVAEEEIEKKANKGERLSLAGDEPAEETGEIVEEPLEKNNTNNEEIAPWD